MSVSFSGISRRVFLSCLIETAYAYLAALYTAHASKEANVRHHLTIYVAQCITQQERESPLHIQRPYLNRGNNPSAWPFCALVYTCGHVYAGRV
jgi:hypothetical protein